MSKHTLGPWEIVNRIPMEDGSVYPIHIVDCQNQHQICMMESLLMAEKAFYRDDLEQKLWDSRIMYNARLIASAPELLEALKAISQLGDNDADCNHSGEYLDARKIARQAIAKAKGGKQ